MHVIFPVMGAENVAVCYLSTVLKERGHTVQVAFDRSLFDDKQYFSVSLLARMCSDKTRMVKEIIRSKPDVLAFSCFADNYQWCLDVARAVRSRLDCISVFGGIHPTSCPEEVIANTEVDHSVVGEGEAPLTELLEALHQGYPHHDIPNVWTKAEETVIRNAPRPLMSPEEFPKVDKTIFEDFIPMREYYLTVTSKGCISACSYCMQNFLKRWEKENNLGSFLREKSVDDVLDELRTMRKRYDIRYVDIKNNVLSGNRTWLREFLDRYPQEVGLPFRIMGHPLLFQGDLAKRLKSAGCHHVQLGIESFSAEVRSEVLQRYENDEQILTALKNLDDAGVNFSADLIVGLPGECEDDLIRALETLSHYPSLIRASIFWLQYLPQVDITQQAERQGLLDDKARDMIVKGLQDNYLFDSSARSAEGQEMEAGLER